LHLQDLAAVLEHGSACASTRDACARDRSRARHDVAAVGFPGSRPWPRIGGGTRAFGRHCGGPSRS